MDTLVAVAGALLGTLVGSSITYFTQREAYRREATERYRTFTKESALGFLDKTQVAYESVVAAYASEQAALRPSLPLPQPPVNSWVQGQQAVEVLRLSCSDALILKAEAMWAHLRSNHIADGQAKSFAAVTDWKRGYWSKRKQFINQARADLGSTKLGSSGVAANSTDTL